MTERLHFHFSLSCIGEGNGNPLQCSCLENSRDGGAWWGLTESDTTEVTWLYGVAQSQIRLKWHGLAYDMSKLLNLCALQFTYPQSWYIGNTCFRVLSWEVNLKKTIHVKDLLQCLIYQYIGVYIVIGIIASSYLLWRLLL